jgi:O-antigen/teichoic acid export membrane protein
MSLRSIAYALSPSAAHPLLKRIEASDIGLRLARGLFWSIAGIFLSRGLMLCASILVARILGKTAFGELGMIQSTIGMLGVFAGFGLGLTATKHVAELRQTDPGRAGHIIRLSGFFATITAGVMTLLLLIFAPWLASHINAPHLSSILRVGAIILFLSALNGAQIGALSGFEAFKTIGQVNVVLGLLSFPTLVAGAYLGGLSATVWALSINLVFNWLLNHLALRREAERYRVPLSLAGCWREWPILWKYSLPAVLAGSIVGPASWICNAMLVNRTGGYEEMGIFNAADQWYAILLFFPGIIGQVLLPILSNKIRLDNSAQSVKALVLATTLNFVIVTPLIIIFALASGYIMSLYGKSFGDSWPTLVIVLLTAGFFLIQSPVSLLITASGRMWLGLAMHLGWALVFIFCSYFLTEFGSIGLASARLLGYIAQATWASGFAFLLIRRRRNAIL